MGRCRNDRTAAAGAVSRSGHLPFGQLALLPAEFNSGARREPYRNTSEEGPSLARTSTKGGRRTEVNSPPGKKFGPDRQIEPGKISERANATTNLLDLSLTDRGLATRNYFDLSLGHPGLSLRKGERE